MRITSWLGATVLFLASAALAQEERIIDNFAGVGARAMGMGGSFVGVADDFTAVYWNPAGLAQLTRSEVQASFTRSGLTMDSRRSGVQASDDLTSTRIGTLGGVYCFPVERGSLVVAGGYNRIQGFDWVLREVGTDADSLQTNHSYRHEGGLGLTSLAAAMDVSPTLSLGASVGFTGGEDQSAATFEWRDPQDKVDWNRIQTSETFTDDYDIAFQASMGAMMRLPRERPRVRLGGQVLYSGVQSISYVFRGNPSTTGYDRVEYDNGEVVEPGEQAQLNGSYEISVPLQLSVGASVVPRDGLLVALSLHLAEWEQTEYKGHDPQGLRSGASFDQQYRNALRYHVGAEWQVPTVALDLRAGYYTDPLPFAGPLDPTADVNEETNPVVAVDQDRRFVTLGAGMTVDQVLHLDLAWVHGSYEQHEGRLKEKWTGNRVLASAACRF